jgi:hypothetical protein
MSGRKGMPVYAPKKPLYNFLGRINPSRARDTFKESNARISRLNAPGRYAQPKLKKSTTSKSFKGTDTPLISGLRGHHTQTFLKQRNLLKEQIAKLRKKSG